MTRLSESLHGAADRAPLGDATVSVESAASRIRRQRAARGAGNVAAGVGALALVVGGVFAPGFGARDADPDMAGLAPAPNAEDSFKGLDGAMTAESSRLADWGFCGSFPLRDWGRGDDSFSLSVLWDSADEVEPETTLTFPVVVTSNIDSEVATTGPVAVVLWDGMVVARIDNAAELEQLSVSEGQEIDGNVSIPLTSCFDGEPLPASKYELLVTQSFEEVAVDPEPAPEPTVEPAPAPSPGKPDGDAADEDAANAAVTEVLPELDVVETFPTWSHRAVGEPIPFVIAGEPVEDPFGEHIPQPWTPPAKPDDALTPQIARDLFKASAARQAWDFAPGTSRYVLRTDDADGSDDQWRETFFGCSWDGQEAGFPARSADLGLLDFDYSGPSNINVSYGWVVDGNPVINVGVTNTSDYALPGFYGQPSRSLYLVKDGKVVAEAYPTDLDRYGDVAIMEDQAAFDAKSATSSTLVLPDTGDYWGMLEPGDTLSGEYLWREVNGCWTESGPLDVKPGTYTLVLSQSIYMDNGDYGYAYPVDDLATTYREDSTDGDSGTGGGEGFNVDAAIAPGEPGDGGYEWAELQVWYSVGTVTVTT